MIDDPFRKLRYSQIDMDTVTKPLHVEIERLERDRVRLRELIDAMRREAFRARAAAGEALFRVEKWALDEESVAAAEKRAATCAWCGEPAPDKTGYCRKHAEECPACHGSGAQQERQTCLGCDGAGRISKQTA